MPDLADQLAADVFVKTVRQDAAADLAMTTANRVATVKALPTRTPAQWWDKANAYAAGWAEKLGGSPSLHNTALGLSVAQHETHCGDAWPGEHNWGAVQKRLPNEPEKAALAAAGIVAKPANVKAARDAIAAAIASGTAPPLDSEALHVDSSPGKGWYFVYFWAFATDAEGAALFVHVLAQDRPSCQADLESDAADEQQLAADMYETHYYEGFHDPNQPGGAQANIDDYATALGRWRPQIQAALAGWTPGAVYQPPPDPSTFDLTTTLGVQQALDFLHVVDPPLATDGVPGPLTEAAIMAFQQSHQAPTGEPLDVDGVVGPMTRAALRLALGLQ
jgi:peptidoglycan hydrolase-like protein with peptidoglycan-binding domain